LALEPKDSKARERQKIDEMELHELLDHDDNDNDDDTVTTATVATLSTTTLSDNDPFDELLNNEDHVKVILSDPEVAAAVNRLRSQAMSLPSMTTPDDIATPETEFDEFPDGHADRYYHPAFGTDQCIHALQSESITPEEQALSSFTRSKLKKLPTWDKWHAGERKQLDQFHDLDMFGSPVVPPKDAIILRPHWQRRVKTNGTRRSRLCCDGSLELRLVYTPTRKLTLRA
jgi:hypothetical protein